MRFDRVVVVATTACARSTTRSLTRAAVALHAEATLPPLELADGTKFNTPGIAGHAHSKTTPAVGAFGYILLAISKSLVGDGIEVSIYMGQLRARPRSGPRLIMCKGMVAGRV